MKISIKMPRPAVAKSRVAALLRVFAQAANQGEIWPFLIKKNHLLC